MAGGTQPLPIGAATASPTGWPSHGEGSPVRWLVPVFPEIYESKCQFLMSNLQASEEVGAHTH